MKLAHLSDLHIGKIVNGFSMLDDQAYILTQILQILDQEQPDALLIAGDIYDRSVPSTEAVTLFDQFLTELAKRKLKTFIVSGNHDSAERTAFAAKLIDQSGIHFSPVYNGEVSQFTLQDEYGPVHIYLLPFLKPAVVAQCFPDDEIKTYADALGVAIREMQLDLQERNVLVAHQFVTGALRSDSEEKSLGGTDNIDAEVFADFDYVALGHIHRPQKITANIRYSGSPLKYSFSEQPYEKSVTIVGLGPKADLQIRTIPLVPQKDLQEIKGTFNDLVTKSYYEKLKCDDYFHIILTDERDVLDAVDKLRVIYPNLMQLDYDNARTRAGEINLANDRTEQISPLDLVKEFYQEQNNQALDGPALKIVEDAIKTIWEESK